MHTKHMFTFTGVVYVNDIKVARMWYQYQTLLILVFDTKNYRKGFKYRVVCYQYHLSLTNYYNPIIISVCVSSLVLYTILTCMQL